MAEQADAQMGGAEEWTAPSMLCVEVIANGGADQPDDPYELDDEARTHVVQVLCQEIGIDPRETLSYCNSTASEVPCRARLERSTTLINFEPTCTTTR